MEEAEREEEEEGEEEEEEESPKELEPEEEEMAMAAGGLEWFLCYWLWEEEAVFDVKKSRCRGRLNSERVEDGSAVSHSTRSQLKRRCVFLGGYSVINEH